MDRHNPLPAEYWDYRVMQVTGWTPAEIDDAPGHLVDWFLAFAGTENEVMAEQMERKGR